MEYVILVYIHHFFFVPRFTNKASNTSVKKILPRVNLSFVSASFQASETKLGSDWILFGI